MTIDGATGNVGIVIIYVTLRELYFSNSKQYGSGIGTSLDERLKTDIKTIENGLDKTLLVRDVEYKDSKQNQI
jgi:hypothetical protein